MQLIVLGMHRSGTSAVARLLNMMGCYFAGEGLSNGYSVDNPKGYWERRDVIETNTQLLKSIDCDWDRVANFDLKRVTQDSLRKFNGQVQTLLLNLEANRPWFIKDPRLCLTFPLWRRLLEMPICIVVHRNPIEIAKSLEKRNGYPLKYGLALWEKYLLRAVESSQGLRRLHVSYHALLRDPVQSVGRLFDQLVSLGVAPLRKPAAEEIQAFIDPDLHRQKAADAPNLLNEEQASLARLAESGELLGLVTLPSLSAEAAETLATVESEHRNAEREEADVARRLAELESTLRAREEELTVMNRVSSQQRRAVPLLEKKVSQLELMLDSGREELAKTRRQFEGILDSQRRQLAKVRGQLDQEISARREASDLSEKAENYSQRVRAEIHERDLQIDQVKKLVQELADGLERVTRPSRWKLATLFSFKRSASEAEDEGDKLNRLLEQIRSWIQRPPKTDTVVPEDAGTAVATSRPRRLSGDGFEAFVDWKKRNAQTARESAKAARQSKSS